MNDFHYENSEVKTYKGGEKTIRKVYIKHGKGYKIVTKYRNGKRLGSTKKNIKKSHITLIKMGKFIPGLFKECRFDKKNKTYRCPKQ
jgi:hypothetical protein